MKCTVAWLLVLAMLGCVGCQSGEAQAQPEAQTQSGSVQVTELPTVLDTMEYTLYTNIFYNGTGDDYLGQTLSKTGTFATIRDSFNGVTRYYVWGYNDVTKCCDWQWEFVPQEGVELPPVGSLVRMTGVFAKDEAALDGYWFTDASLETQKIYQAAEYGVDMGTMSATLERVQLINMQVFPEEYAGKTVRMYGRIAGTDRMEHPYYDGAWEQPITAQATLPAIGTLVVGTGIWSDSAVLTDASVEPTTAY